VFPQWGIPLNEKTEWSSIETRSLESLSPAPCFSICVPTGKLVDLVLCKTRPAACLAAESNRIEVSLNCDCGLTVARNMLHLFTDCTVF
jgi:hypothetical protein